ncbi:hypothetical protein BJV77DRAFT_1037977, partial [Russula vinacea]
MTEIIFAIAMAIWITDSSLFLLATIQLRAKWSPKEHACIITNFDANHAAKYAVLSSLFAGTTLFIMLIGLLRLRREGGGAFAMGCTLWKQGLLWPLLAAVGETPSAVLLILNLNCTFSSLNLMTQSPGMIIVTTCATRLYRSFINIYPSDTSLESPRGTGRSVSELRVRSEPIPLSWMEASVPVRTECDQFPMSQMSHSGPYISTIPQGRYEA